MGLEWWDLDIDQMITDLTGNALYALATINEGARWASLGLQTTLDIAAGLLPGSGFYDAFKETKRYFTEGKGGFWAALSVATVAFPLAKKGVEAVAGFRGIFKAFGWGMRACRRTSFVEGTIVDTPAGPTVIDCVLPGDEVVTRSEHDPKTPPSVGRVTQVFRSISPAIVWLTLSTGQLMGTTPSHEVWTEPGGWTYAAALQPGDTFLDALGQPVQVLDALVDQRPTVVYNFEVEGASTYFAEGVWVHNSDSCTLATALARGARLKNTEAWYEEVVRHLSKYAGLNPRVAHDRIEQIKKAQGLGPADNVFVGLSGDVFHPFSGDWIGSLTSKW